ncbi:MAG: T9SS type A sorting domain-containing protein [Bacteroidetes bacterium]|nr:T9SS type A sorting domain-containing protein [Bacteroidota bacterium]
MKTIFTWLFIFCTLIAGASNETNIWYFGNGCGLDFNSGSPVSINGGMVYTYEGCSSICDSNGDLLFYSDGLTVWNKNHQVMSNGTGLTGDYSSTQSAMIVQQPGNTNIYYVFTTFTTLNYSVVDMTLNGGLGDVTPAKNVFMMTGAEKLCAVKHSNGNDVWIIMHESGTDGFNAFLLTSAGIAVVPVHSNTGLADGGIVGQMKVSPTGTKIAIGLFNAVETVSLCDFDPATGIASNGFAIPTLNVTQSYGVEFSPDGSKLYNTGENSWFNITQYDMNAGTPAAIIASATIIGTTGGVLPAGMQLGPDLKIYVTLYQSGFLAVINDPNVLGTGCNFVDNAVSLGVNVCQIGLPGNVASLFASNLLPNAIFSSPNHICPGTCTNFTNLSVNANAFLWSFPGANPSTSTDVDPSNICYNSPGQYDVQLIASNANGSDTLLLHNYITVYPYPAPQGISQNGDTLFANQGAVSYQWYHDGLLVPGATNYFYIADSGGNYNVVATDANGCEVEAVIFDVVAAVQNPTSDVGFTIFPNPVIDKLSIQNLNFLNGETKDISIYNILNEKVFSMDDFRISRNSYMDVDCHLLSSGMYWLELNGGNKSVRIKFIKK